MRIATTPLPLIGYHRTRQAIAQIQSLSLVDFVPSAGLDARQP